MEEPLGRLGSSGVGRRDFCITNSALSASSYILCLSTVSFAECILQQPCPRWWPTGSMGLHGGCQKPHCWTETAAQMMIGVFRKITFAVLWYLIFWAFTNILKTTSLHLMPEKLSAELLSASLFVFCCSTNNYIYFFSPLMHLLLAKPVNWSPWAWSLRSSVEETWPAGFTFCWIHQVHQAASDKHVCWSSDNNSVSPYIFNTPTPCRLSVSVSFTEQ